MSKRPIDKKQVNGVVSSLSTTQQNDSLFAASEAQTFVGGELKINIVYNGHSAGIVNVGFALLFKRDGQTVSSMNINDGQVMYEPEQDVFVQDLVNIYADGAQQYRMRFKIKSKRKMQNGDSIVLAMQATTGTNPPHLNYTMNAFFLG